MRLWKSKSPPNYDSWEFDSRRSRCKCKHPEADLEDIAICEKGTWHCGYAVCHSCKHKVCKWGGSHIYIGKPTEKETERFREILAYYRKINDNKRAGA